MRTITLLLTTVLVMVACGPREATETPDERQAVVEPDKAREYRVRVVFEGLHLFSMHEDEMFVLSGRHGNGDQLAQLQIEQGSSTGIPEAIVLDGHQIVFGGNIVTPYQADFESVSNCIDVTDCNPAKSTSLGWMASAGAGVEAVEAFEEEYPDELQRVLSARTAMPMGLWETHQLQGDAAAACVNVYEHPSGDQRPMARSGRVTFTVRQNGPLPIELRRFDGQEKRRLEIEPQAGEILIRIVNLPAERPKGDMAIDLPELNPLLPQQLPVLRLVHQCGAEQLSDLTLPAICGSLD